MSVAWSRSPDESSTDVGQPTDPFGPTRLGSSPGRALAVGLLVGIVLGPLDLVLQRGLPYPFANLANSSAVWAVCAFLVGWWCGGRRWWQAGAAAVIAMVVAVETYYLAAARILGDDPAMAYGASARLWLLLALGAGVVFSTAGSWARQGGRWPGALGTAVGAGVLFAEAALDLLRAGAADAAQARDLRQTALLVAGAGVLMVLLGARSSVQRCWAAALTAGLTGLGLVAFLILGFG